MLNTCIRGPLQLLVLSGVLILCEGCNNKNSWQADVYPTTGTVTINGQVPEHAIVMLHYQGENHFDKRLSICWGMVDSQGQFDITTYELKDGAPVGEYALTLMWPSDRQKKSDDRLRGLYSNPESPVTMVTVTKGKNVLAPIKLEGVQVLPKGE